MREIRFRAWDDEVKVMYYRIGLTPFEILLYEDVGNKMKVPEIVGRIGIERDEIHVMQYTGLKDKNGKEIYESDIVATDGYGNQKVHYDAPMFRVGNLDSLEYWTGKDVEVIGNIYENPELLK
jgi:uncharacterized phage protein (TIGR01671 family)